MWKATKWGFLALAVVLLIVLAGVVGRELGDNGDTATVGEPSAPTPIITTTAGDAFGVLDEIYRILAESFVDPNVIDPELLKIGAINGIIQALGDPHTVYIDPVSYSLGIDIFSGTFQGIGAQVEQDPITNEIVIVTPFRDSPAEQAGVRAGDIIRTVNGESTEGWSVTQAVQRIRGPEGTDVTLTVQHRDGAAEEITIVRSTIVIPTVFTNVGEIPDVNLEDTDGNPVTEIAYIEIQQLTNETLAPLSELLRDIEDQGYKALILDLRRNPGGGLSVTIDVADMFLESGLILTEVDREGRETVFEARPGGEAEDIPMVVLIGPGSASGAEVIAGALRDHQRAVLIGEVTFGKGSVNQVRQLSDGGALYVTTARWLTPSGEQIEGVGLAPDIEITLTEEDIDLRLDRQLFGAIDYLRENFLLSRS